MVSRRAKIFLCLLMMLVCFINITDVSSQNGELTYQIDQEWAKIWINKDGNIDLFYNITFTVHSASIGFLTLPMPNSFNIIYVNDSMGSPIPYEDISEGSFYGVDIQFIPRIQTGNSANVLILANVEKMIR
ncbi:MAG: hypothetical protein JSV20_02105, partial [Candidatus Bathyarchaeota archaeon]